jgi:hypothetical protein
MSFWAFAGGAANSLLEDRKAQQASAEEQRLWEQRIKFQQKLQEDFEKAKAKNRVIASGVDTKTGEAFEVTVGGEERRTKLPEVAVNQARSAEQSALDQAARDQMEFDTKLDKDKATAESARARAAAASSTAKSRSLESAAKAKYYEAGGSRKAADDPAKKLEKDADSVFKTIDKDEFSSPEKKALARRVRFNPNMSAQEKMQALLEIMEAEDD